MNQRLSLKIVLGLSIAGMLFSGYLSWSELFARSCAIGGCTNVGSVPACVYGFAMYLIVFAVSLWGLLAEQA